MPKVQLVELTMQQHDVLCVLLTGRGESNFTDIIKRMIKSRNLEFAITCLKPTVGPNNQTFGSTLKFKQEFLSDLVYTYKDADEIRIYEDRPRHVREFREFFHTFNQTLRLPDTPISRKPITTEVIQVPEGATSLDPVTEVAEVQRMINSHNTAVRDGSVPPTLCPFQINRQVLYTGYILSPTETEKLIQLVQLPQNQIPSDIQYLANNVLICARSAPQHILDRVGGIGNEVHWRVTGLSALEGKLWAARVAPVSDHARVYTENPTPLVILAMRRSAQARDAARIQNWKAVPQEQQVEFESTVGEKVLLRVDREKPGEDDWEAPFSRRENPRKHPRDEDFPPLGPPSAPATRHQRDQPVPAIRGADENRKPSGGNHPRGGGGGFRGGRGGHGDRQRGGGNQGRGGRDQRRGAAGGQGAGGRGRGRGAHSQYRSLDDVGDRGSGGHRPNAHADFDGANDSRDGGLYNAY